MLQNYFDTVTLPYFTADFDYFRIPRARWEFMLTRLKQMGANAVTVTAPWGFHEFSRSTVDLTGATHTRRDLAGLINLCTALEFHCILKPGPYNHQGVLGDGIPVWLRQSKDFEAALLPAVEGWYKAISKTLAGQQWPTGPIVAIYIETEPAEKHSPTFSKHLIEVKWRIWLRKRYEGIEALNEAYDTTYRTVNDVEFPATWTKENTLLERDAKEFLEKVQRDTQARYDEILVGAGWQIPIYPSAKEIHHHLPVIRPHTLTNNAESMPLDLENTILNLQDPIQVDPDPTDIGQGPVWAMSAPIRSDGSVRRGFWETRQGVWQHSLPHTNTKGKTLKADFATDSLITYGGDTTVKLAVTADTKPTAYRLRLNGELVIDEELKVKRGKLSGTYQAEDEADQTDLVFILSDPTAPLTDFPLTYLRSLLLAQAQTLAQGAYLSQQLGQTLAATPANADASTSPERSVHTISTLEEARRGLSEADAALRKAIDSISGLEDGFATILSHSDLAIAPQPATAPVTINPEIFEGPARENLLEIGTRCAELAPLLASTAATLRRTADTARLTVEKYQENYTSALDAAQTARETLLKIITQLRLDIAAEKLPLVLWRIHDQVLEIAEMLRWGVLRH